MGCDMCGTDATLYLTDVEGVDMELCDECKVYGEVKRPVDVEPVKLKKKRAPEPLSGPSEDLVVPDYGRRVKEGRERRGLKQSELAQRLGLKESQLHKYESGAHEPDLATARQLESALGISLVESYREEKPSAPAASGGSLTIGDLLKKK